jgi:AcrR family transcriptional regulator
VTNPARSSWLPALLDSTPRLPTLPPGTVRPEARARRRYTGYYARRARAIYELQVRDHIVRARSQNRTFKEIAQELGLSIPTVRAYFQKSLDRAVAMMPFDADTAERYDEDLPPNRRRFSSGPQTVEGDVLPPPDEQQDRREALQLAKACVPYDEIAARLGITEKRARIYVHESLTQIEKSELNGADLQRRLMIEQINEMIQALYAPATGNHPEKGKTAPILEAVDRMMKLLKQKADLMGLGQPELTDIRMQLQALATQHGYDIQELEDVARDVLPSHRIRLPGF